MNRHFNLIYASQTGQAKAIAESIYDLASKNNFESNLYCMADFETDFKLNEFKTPVVFIISTTGDGEPPDNGVKCYNKLRSKDLPTDHLSNLNYALLGLGDSNYAQFCNGPKLFHKVFQHLGAKCFYGPSWADDGTGLESEVEPFIEGLWSALEKEIKRLSESNVAKLTSELENLKIKSDVNDFETPLSGIELTVPQLTDQHLFIEYTDESTNNNEIDTKNEIEFIKHCHPNMYEARIINKKLLTTSDYVKTKYYLSFIKESQELFSYEPGHSIDVICPNDDNEIEVLFKCLSISDKHRKIKFKMSNSKKTAANLVKLADEVPHMSLYYLFKYCLDIRNNSLKKALLRTLAESCQNEQEKRRLLELCSKEGSLQYQEKIKNNSFSLVDLLKTFPSCKPPIDFLIQQLSALQPRSYSLCTCMSDSNMEIVFNLVQFDSTQSRTYDRFGVGTGYLSRLGVNDKFYYVKRLHQNFALPENYNQAPLIMVGPGTGVAPFISFLRHKQANMGTVEQNESAEWWLLYGCRDPNKDFLFKRELCDVYARDLRLIKKFCVAYSRFTSVDSSTCEFHEPSSKYVQDIIRSNGKQIVDLIVNKNAYIYVCGDAKNMAKDVFSCLASCIESEHIDTIKDASKYLIDMMASKRYKQDIWN